MRAVKIADTEVRTVTSASKMGTTRLHNFFGQGGLFNAGPQAFLVEMLDPNSRIDPHFHDVDQFQVVVKGDGHIGGRLGGHALHPIAVHYADAYAPYGPIAAHEHGLAYYTIRMACAGGYWGMPENRQRSRPGRQFTGDFDAHRAPPAKGSVDVVRLRDDDADGLAIVGLHIGPDTSATANVSGGGGQYLLVCAGTLELNGESLPADSLLLTEAGEFAPELKSGPHGAAVLVMQFPRPSDRPGSDPKSLGDRPPHYKLPPGAKVN